MSARYSPGFVPQDPKELVRFIEEELYKISTALNSIAEGYLEVTHVEPSKKEPMIKFADGTNWNPGSGRGIYYYDDVSATWKPLINDVMLGNDIWG